MSPTDREGAHVDGLDDEDVVAAMRAFVQARDEVARAVKAADSAAEYASVLDVSERATLARMALRGSLRRTGWTAPTGQLPAVDGAAADVSAPERH